MGGGGDRSDKYSTLCLTSAPKETLRLEAEIDATEQGGKYYKFGIYPQIAALEALAYPSIESIDKMKSLMEKGQIGIIPPESPYTLLVWGEKRVIPVQITDFTITEEMYDPNLNPIRAKVSLNMKVLTYNDVPAGHIIYHYFGEYHQRLEGMAEKARRKS
jgi:hypothetical protein